MARRPAEDEYAPYYRPYVDRVPDGDIAETLRRQGQALVARLDGLSPSLETHRYAEGKWTVRDVVGHLVDAERVFAFRALHFARGAPEALPGFDEKAWARSSNAGKRSLSDLLVEFSGARAATVALFRSFTPDMMDAGGIASGHPVTVRALAWITAGHAAHHLRILEERYLGGAGSGAEDAG